MSNQKKPNGYWNKERCTTEALKYKSRSEFKKLGRSAFASANKNDWLDEVCIHMETKKKPNGYWDKDRCAYEAKKYATRTEFQKSSNSAYGQAHRNGWLDEICNHMKVKPNKVSFTKQQCIDAAQKYSSRSEFKRENSPVYRISNINGWLDEVCAHMASKRKPKSYWTKERCVEEAKQYSSRSEFSIRSKSAFIVSKENDWLDDACAHMTIAQRPAKYWTKPLCVEEAQKYTTITAFQKTSRMAYKVAKENNWLDECCAHMKAPQKPQGYWTKERCSEEAQKYTTRGDFQKNCESAYSKARKSGWLDDLCKHMVRKQKPSGYWTKERCKAEAERFNSRLDFQKGHESAYTKARKSGWLDDICSHMIENQKPNGYWTKERCLEEALKYETRTDFAVESNGAYRVARTANWLDEICNHMTPVGNIYLRGIYLIVNKRLSKAYIGLTSNFQRRKEEHSKPDGSRTNAAEIMKERDTEFIPLTDYVETDKAANLEAQYIEEYKLKGFELLNDQSRVGGLGGSRLKWTEELCHQEALKYKTKKEFNENNRPAYVAAQRQGIVDKICSHMVQSKREVYWTKELLIAEALKYSSRSEFSKKSGGAYSVARTKFNCLDEICSHMTSKNKPSGYWNKERCQDVALKCTKLSEFRKSYPTAYNKVKSSGWADEIFQHLDKEKKPKGYWTKEMCSIEALKFSSKVEFERKCSSAVQVARKNGWLDDICSHMVATKKPLGYWTKERCQKEALKYNTRTNFSNGNSSAYKKARDEKWLDDICSHMKALPKPKSYWTKESCAIEALKYDTRSSFSKGSYGAYTMASKAGWLDEVCQHMKSRRASKS